MNKEEKDEYNAIKELLDEFNNSANINLQNIIVENKDEEVKKQETNEDNKDTKLKEKSIILEENESFSERITSTKNDDFLYVHFKDKIFKIKTKNLLIMRE